MRQRVLDGTAAVRWIEAPDPVLAEPGAVVVAPMAVATWSSP